MNDLYAPPGTDWQRLSPNFLRMKLLLIPTVWALLFAAPVFAAFRWGPDWLGWAALAAALAWIGWRCLRAPRVFRRWGYAERGEDVYLTHGLFHRELTCVPYGRMQLVRVNSGPLQRAFGLSTVEMVTASSEGSISIPGLSADDAAALRDRLIERGETQQAGI